MSTITMTLPPTPSTNGRTDKSSKNKSKIVVLSVPASILMRFLPKKQSPSVASSPTPPKVEELPQLKTQDNPSEANSTPAPTQDASTPNGAILQNGNATTNGVKRSTPMPVDGAAKPRGKPGPKKKPRLEDGTIDHSATKPIVMGTANHKLGPKANTGFINANLRALDRTGTPCRRWARKGFQVKSFTGHAWELPSWTGSSSSALADGTSDSSNKEISMQDSSEQRPSESDTAAGSNTGDHQDKMDISTPAASSPPATFRMFAPPPSPPQPTEPTRI